MNFASGFTLELTCNNASDEKCLKIQHRFQRPLDLSYPHEVALIDCYHTGKVNKVATRVVAVKCNVVDSPQQIPSPSVATKILRFVTLPNSVPIGIPLYVPVVKKLVQSIELELLPVVAQKKPGQKPQKPIIQMPGIEPELEEDAEEEMHETCLLSDDAIVKLLHFRHLKKPHCTLCRSVWAKKLCIVSRCPAIANRF